MKELVFLAKNKKQLDVVFKATFYVLIFQILLVIVFIAANIFGFTILNLIDVLNLSILGYIFILQRNRLFGFLLVFYQLINFLNNFPSALSWLYLIFLLSYLRAFVSLLYIVQQKRNKKVPVKAQTLFNLLGF